MARLLILLLLIIPNSFYAQTIEAINSNEQALAFLKKVKPGFMEILPDAEIKHARDSLWPFLNRFNYYEKADFDNNGYNDLLFNGFSGYRCGDVYNVCLPLVILSFGNDSFRIKDISCKKYVTYLAAKTVPTGGQPLIEITCAGYEAEYNTRSHPIERVDTLVYAFDEFIENTQPVHHTVERISVTRLGFAPRMNDSSSFELTFSRDSTWLTRQIVNGSNWTIKKYVAHTDTTNWNRLTGLLNCMNFPRLKEYYSTGQYHEPLGLLS